MSEWKQCLLGSIAEVQTGPFGSQLKNEQYITGGTPVITVEHINAFRIQNIDYPSVTEADRKRLERYSLNAGDIVFTRVGSVDLSAYVKPENQGWLFSSRMLRVRVSTVEVDPLFLSYFFRQEKFREYILNIAVGATMPSINTQILKDIPISYPPLPEQKAIASVLSSLDNKIDLLHRQNKTLEAMAETLFRQWFIEGAKEDWEETKVLDVFSLVGGGTPKTSEATYWDGDIPWLSGGDIANAHQGFLVSAEKSITALGLDKSSTKLLPKLASVISARGTVGKYAMLSRPMTFSQSNYGILPKGHQYYYFVYLLLAYIVDELLAAAYGSVFDTITTRTFEDVGIKLPSMDIVAKFESEIAPIFEKKLNNVEQIQTLEKLRDTLLPKLMNGEVTVKWG